MTSSDSSTITLNADQEHAGLRAAVLLIVLGGFVVGFVIVNAILSKGDGLAASYSFPLSCILALLLALGAAAVAESIMKRTWTSGRRVEIDDHEFRAWLPGGETVSLDWSGLVWAILWTFPLAGYPRGGRERRLRRAAVRRRRHAESPAHPGQADLRKAGAAAHSVARAIERAGKRHGARRYEKYGMSSRQQGGAMAIEKEKLIEMYTKMLLFYKTQQKFRINLPLS